MQLRFEEQWKRLSDRNAQPMRLNEEIGVINDEGYIRLVAPAFYFRGILPDQGGLNDQDETVITDIYMWIAGMAREQWLWDEVHKDSPRGGKA